MSLRCRFGFHTPKGWAARPGFFGAGRCVRCRQAIGGIAIDRPAPKPAPIAKRVAPSWLCGIYENSRKGA